MQKLDNYQLENKSFKLCLDQRFGSDLCKEGKSTRKRENNGLKTLSYSFDFPTISFPLVNLSINP